MLRERRPEKCAKRDCRIVTSYPRLPSAVSAWARHVRLQLSSLVLARSEPAQAFRVNRNAVVRLDDSGGVGTDTRDGQCASRGLQFCVVQAFWRAIIH